MYAISNDRCHGIIHLLILTAASCAVNCERIKCRVDKGSFLEASQILLSIDAHIAKMAS